MGVGLGSAVRELFSDLVIFVIVSELWLGHNSLSDWDIDVMLWHRVQSSAETPEVCKHFKSINLLEPLFVHQLGVNLSTIHFLRLLVEILALHNVFWQKVFFIFVILVDIIELILMEDIWVVVALIQKGFFVKVEKFIESYLRVNYKK